MDGLYVQRNKRAKSSKNNTAEDSKIETKEMNQVLKHGTHALFNENDDNSFYDKDMSEEKIDGLLDRQKHFEKKKEMNQEMKQKIISLNSK